MELTKSPKQSQNLFSPLGEREFKRCPFGLAQAPAYFQRLFNEVLAPFDFAFGYLDDILIYSPDMLTHLKYLEMIFQRLRETHLKLRIDKCNFMSYLQMPVSMHGLVYSLKSISMS